MNDDTQVAVIETPQKQITRLAQVGRQLQGPEYVSDIQGKQYPKVEWWTTMGAHAGLTALEQSSRIVHCADHDGEHYGYEATVEVMDAGGVIRSRASMICLSCESRSKRTNATWGDNGEYAVKSMALTRATSKAFRINLSYLAVMAGLEATPADEVPEEGFSDSTSSRKDPYGVCALHGTPFFKSGNMRSPAHKYGPDSNERGDEWCNKPEAEETIQPDDPVAQEVQAEWNAAFARVQEVFAQMGITTQKAKLEAIEEAVGKVKPAELTPDELDALADTLKLRMEAGSDEPNDDGSVAVGETE